MAEEFLGSEAPEGKAYWLRASRGKVTGVWFHSGDRRWCVKVQGEGIAFTIGRFKWKRDAEAALKEVEGLSVAALASIEARWRGSLRRNGHQRTYPFFEAVAGGSTSFRGKRYEGLGETVVVLADRAAAELVDKWRTHCDSCGREVVFYLRRPGSQDGLFEPVTHCEKHAAKMPRKHKAVRVAREVLE